MTRPNLFVRYTPGSTESKELLGTVSTVLKRLIKEHDIFNLGKVVCKADFKKSINFDKSLKDAMSDFWPQTLKNRFF